MRSGSPCEVLSEKNIRFPFRGLDAITEAGEDILDLAVFKRVQKKVGAAQ